MIEEPTHSALIGATKMLDILIEQLLQLQKYDAERVEALIVNLVEHVNRLI